MQNRQGEDGGEHAIDLQVKEGSNIGLTAASIYTIEGNTLKYLYSGPPRTTEFTTKPGDGRHYQVFRRVER